MADLEYLLKGVIFTASKEVILDKIRKVLDKKVKMPNSIKEIANFMINDFKDLNEEESKVLSEILKVQTIRDLANVDYRQFFKKLAYLEDAGIPRNKIELIIAAAKFIVNVASYRPVEGQKIVFMGLDNAGKTALMRIMKGQEVGLSSLAPTRGVQQEILYLRDEKIIFYELGGQEPYRKQYLEHPEQYLFAIDFMLFVIDMQDEERYNKALEYLQEIIQIVSYLNETPKFIILLHKVDPEIIEVTPFFQNKISYMTGRVKELFKSYNLEYEIQVSSIFNEVAPSFPRLLRKLFTTKLENYQKLSINQLQTEVAEMISTLKSDLTKELDIIKQNLDNLNIRIRNLE